MGTETPESDTERPRQPENRLVVEGVSVVTTSGTATLRDVRADQAILHETTRYLEATSVTMTLRFPEKDVTITATASSGDVYLATEGGSEGKKTRPQKEEPSEPVGYERIQEIAALPRDRHQFGDVVLHGPVMGQTNNGGRFYTQTAIWSESLKRLLVPTPFRQVVRSPDGSQVEMNGVAFEVDSTLRRWTYYSHDGPWELKWRAPEGEGNSAGRSKAPARKKP